MCACVIVVAVLIAYHVGTTRAKCTEHHGHGALGKFGWWIGTPGRAVRDSYNAGEDSRHNMTKPENQRQEDAVNNLAESRIKNIAAGKVSVADQRKAHQKYMRDHASGW
jgi:hypothetical protein